MNVKTPWVTEGWPRLQREWIGRRARLRRPVQNASMTVARGTIIEIDDVVHAENIGIKSPPCEHCGVAIRMTRLSWRDLSIFSLPADDQPSLPLEPRA